MDRKLLLSISNTHVMNVDKDQDTAPRPGGDKTAKKAEWDCRADRWRNWGFQWRFRCEMDIPIILYHKVR
jgi:hypothetical protein